MTADEPLEVLRVRHGRTPIGVPLAVFSAVCGLGCAISPALRSGAVEGSFANGVAIAWYVVLFVGAVLLIFAVTSPYTADGYAPNPNRGDPTPGRIARRWAALVAFAGRTCPPRLLHAWRRLSGPFSRPWCDRVDPVSYPRIIARLYAEQGGLYLTGWQWMSYGFAAFARQGLGGFTAAALASAVGAYTGLRLIQLHYGTKELRAWRDRTRSTTREA